VNDVRETPFAFCK